VQEATKVIGIVWGTTEVVGAVQDMTKVDGAGDQGVVEI
jgi:hypothetical protein